MNFKPPSFLLVGLPTVPDKESATVQSQRARQVGDATNITPTERRVKRADAAGRPATVKFDKTSLQQLDQALSRAREVGIKKIGSIYAEVLNEPDGSAAERQKFREMRVEMDDRFQNALKSTLAHTWRPVPGAGSLHQHVKVDHRLRTVVQDLNADLFVRRVGMLDLGAWISKLQALIVLLNKGQTMCTLFEVQVPVPGGLIKTERGFFEWAQSRLGPQSDPREFEEVPRQMIADDFFKLGNNARTALGLDVLVGLTSAGIADVEGSTVRHSQRVASADGLLLLSIAGLRTLSDEAKRPYEAAIGMLLLRMLIGPARAGHSRDCAMSSSMDMYHLRSALGKMSTCPACVGLLRPDQLHQVDSALKMLRAMRRPRKAKPKEAT